MNWLETTSEYFSTGFKSRTFISLRPRCSCSKSGKNLHFQLCHFIIHGAFRCLKTLQLLLIEKWKRWLYHISNVEIPFMHNTNSIICELQTLQNQSKYLLMTFIAAMVHIHSFYQTYNCSTTLHKTALNPKHLETKLPRHCQPHFVLNTLTS